MTGNGTNQTADKNLGDIVSEVSEKASLLVRQEIDLAKAEITDKATKLAKGAGIAAAAGVFLVFGVTMFFHGAGLVPRRPPQPGGQHLGRLRDRHRVPVPARDHRGVRRLAPVQEGRAAHAGHGDRGGQEDPFAVRGPEDRA